MPAEEEGPAVALLAQDGLHKRPAVRLSVRQYLICRRRGGIIAGLRKGTGLVAVAGRVGDQPAALAVRTEKEPRPAEEPLVEEVSENSRQHLGEAPFVKPDLQEAIAARESHAEVLCAELRIARMRTERLRDGLHNAVRERHEVVHDGIAGHHDPHAARVV